MKRLVSMSMYRFSNMTLPEAIKHAKDVAKNSCGECGKDHKQLAEWLEELNDLRKKNKNK